MNAELQKHYCSDIRPTGPVIIWKNLQLSLKTNGQVKKVKLSIQDIPENRYDDVIRFMKDYFIESDTLFSGFGIKNNPEAIEEIQVFWREVLKCGFSVAAFIDDPEIDGKTTIVGANILFLSTNVNRFGLKKVHNNFRTENIRQLMNVMDNLSPGNNTSRNPNFKCLSSLGLGACTNCSEEILQNLLAASVLLCQKYEFTATGNLLANSAMISLAKSRGYKRLVGKPIHLIKKFSNIFDPKKCAHCTEIVFMWNRCN